MNKLTCNNCGLVFDEERNYCPSCWTPTLAQQQKTASIIRKRCILGITCLTVFCVAMMLWLPRG